MGNPYRIGKVFEVVKRLNLLIKLVKCRDMVVDCFLWLIFQRNQLFECVALTQHRNIPKTGSERTPYIASRFAVPDKLKFGFDNGGNEDTHGIAVSNLECCDSFCRIVFIRWVSFAGDEIVQSFAEFDLAFEAPLFVGTAGESVDCTHDSVQCWIRRHGENNE